MQSALYEATGQVAVVTLNNPPINGLGLELRRGIIAAIDRAIENPEVRAIVLIGSDRAFSGGADVKEFGTPKSSQEPNLLTVIRRIESCPKPVIAAISGACMGGGLELALGSSFPGSQGGCTNRPTGSQTGLAARSRRHPAFAASGGIGYRAQHDRLRKSGASRPIESDSSV